MLVLTAKFLKRLPGVTQKFGLTNKNSWIGSVRLVEDKVSDY